MMLSFQRQGPAFIRQNRLERPLSARGGELVWGRCAFCGQVLRLDGGLSAVS